MKKTSLLTFIFSMSSRFIFANDIGAPDFSSFAESWLEAVSAVFFIFAAIFVFYQLINNYDKIVGKNKDLQGVTTDIITTALAVGVCAITAGFLSDAG